MLTCDRLRIDPAGASTAVDYRITNGCVETRNLQLAEDGRFMVEKDWHRLTPEQLSSLVMTNALLAHWLTRRMGIFPAIQACTRNSSTADTAMQDDPTGLAA
jgi:hypothetical protein